MLLSNLNLEYSNGAEHKFAKCQMVTIREITNGLNNETKYKIDESVLNILVSCNVISIKLAAQQEKM